MVTTNRASKNLLVEKYITRLETGQALLNDTEQNLIEVVGILKSYGVVLDAYSNNLCYIANTQFLKLFPFFKYLNGDVTPGRLWRNLIHDRINYEYAEYCMKSMFWHGGGGLDAYLDSPEFAAVAEEVIQAKFKYNPLMMGLHKIFKDFLPEQMRQMAYYSGLGQFWRVMSDIFIELSDRYDAGEIKSIPDVVQHILDGLVKDAAKPITYTVTVGQKQYDGERGGTLGSIWTTGCGIHPVSRAKMGEASSPIASSSNHRVDIIPKSAGITFLMDTGVPYIEAIFFRGTPFPGTISYNAQAYQIPYDQGMFNYGALYADPLPIGSAGIPPTLLMQDMRHFIPNYLMDIYQQGIRGKGDLKIKICQSFQKSMFCVTTAAIKGLAPYPLDTTDSEEKAANRKYLKGWLDRLLVSQMIQVNSGSNEH